MLHLIDDSKYRNIYYSALWARNFYEAILYSLNLISISTGLSSSFSFEATSFNLPCNLLHYNL